MSRGVIAGSALDGNPSDMIGLLDRYGLAGWFRLLADVVHTRLLVSGSARIIRRPVYIRGKRFIRFGKRLTTGVGLRLDAFPATPSDAPCIMFGDDVQLNDYVHIAAASGVTIGNNVLIASKVFISDHNHGSYGADGLHDSPDLAPALRPLRVKPVFIEDNVWLGEFVSVMPGVTIGRGSVIGAASVVTNDIPPYSVAVGAPARVIKRFDFTEGKWVASGS